MQRVQTPVSLLLRWWHLWPAGATTGIAHCFIVVIAYVMLVCNSASDKAVLAQVQQRVKTYEDDVVDDVRTLAQKVMELGL